MIVEFCLLIIVAPALIVGVAAQLLVHSTIARARATSARTSGYAAARKMLDAAGLFHVNIEQVPGMLNDHYEARGQILRLGADAFHGRSMAALGVATHEAGHALQYEMGYAAWVVRNLAVPAAHYGSACGLLLMLCGLAFQPLLLLGSFAYGTAVLLQFVNLPLEFDASQRALVALVDLQIVEENELDSIRPVLSAAALTYLAVTLQSVVTLVSALFRFSRRGEKT